jgi:AraC family transcriptional regulator of adaptative response/methylated-DNA-[protein]-cysteine methyltransferase
MSDLTPSAVTERLEAIARHIRDHAEDSLPLAQLATRAALSPAHFQRRFTAHFGVSPKQYQDAHRMRRFKRSLKEGETVIDALTDAGFSSSSRLYGEASRRLGMTPSRYRAGGHGEVIHYALRETIEGPLMMAATAVGVCFAEFGPDENDLRAQLALEFPSAKYVPANVQSAELDVWMTALASHLDDAGPIPDLPLDLRGTAFQLKVWNFLRSLEPGARITYRDVAHGIGAPRAVRAAASACGANRIALLVPCHRVLRGDGGLGGYRWGVELKRRLLKREVSPVAR